MPHSTARTRGRHTGEYVSAKTIVKVALETLQVKRDSLKTRGMNSMVRPVVADALCQYGGFTQRQAADIMDLRSGAAVSLQIKRLHEQILLIKNPRS